MSGRRSVVGAAVGAVGAAAAAGAVTVATRQRRAVNQVKAAAAAAPGRLGRLPADRCGQVLADDGVELYYEEVGAPEAPLTVVFVHGYCLSMGEFHFQRLALAQRFADELRLVFYDQRSHGRSGRSDTAHATVDQLGRDLARVLAERVPRGPLVLVGHSMGGMTIMALADHQPGLFEAAGRVRGLVLMSTSAGKLSSLTLGLPALFARIQTPLIGLLLRVARTQAELIERGRRLGSDLAWTITRRMSFGDDDIDPAVLKYLNDMISATRVEVVADFFPALMQHDKAASLAALNTVDVEIVCGDRDLMLPLAHSQAIAEALPGSHLTVVQGAGHIVVMERPDIVDAVITDLIIRVQKATIQ